MSRTVIKPDRSSKEGHVDDHEDDEIHRISLPPAPALERLSRAPLRGVPPPPPPGSSGASRLFARPATAQPTLLASVRVDGAGQIVSSSGDVDLLSQLVAYVVQLLALVQAELSLDPFAALHAELAGQRIMVFDDAGETVGLMMRPGAEAQDLKQRLGV